VNWIVPLAIFNKLCLCGNLNYWVNFNFKDRVTTFDAKKIKIENIHSLLLNFPCYIVFMIYAYVRIDFVFSSSYSFIAIDML